MDKKMKGTHDQQNQNSPINSDKTSDLALYKAVSNHLCCDLNGESVILCLSTGKYYGVNSVGSFIWSLLQEPKEFTAMKSALMEEFEVDEATCINEVQSFLKKMKDEELVDVTDG